MESGSRMRLRMSCEPIVEEYMPVIRQERFTAHTPQIPTACV